MKGMNTIKFSKLYDSLLCQIYKNMLKGYIISLKQLMGSWANEKTDTGIYEYPSSPSLVLNLGELNDKPKEYFWENQERSVT